MSRTQNILRVDASMRRDGSQSRALTDSVIARFSAQNPYINVTTRDLADEPLPQIDETWINANFTDPDQRSETQRQALAQSDSLVEELKAADTIVIGMPLYNFSVPAALKAWIDLIARARLTFKYTENGPVGLLEGKRAILIVATGGVPVGAPVDFGTNYMRQVLSFVGITDVDVIDASQLNFKADEQIEAAKASIEKLAA
ncbi:MAG: FMN-dependent NADH-azoreductase [Alphaproteobacteria bacterium]|nr:FMN-dependent NADH-azoreductase [Alphaproteobacteria bacterium]